MSTSVTCRDEILSAMKMLSRKYHRDAFTTTEILEQVMTQTKTYKQSTITKEVMFKMRADTPDHHEKTYPDLVRVSRGYYRLA
jgi:hypothetical protein